MILVTGSTGNVGSKLLKELTARKAEFRAFVRQYKDVERLSSQGIEVVHGDVTDVDSIRKALQGVDRVYILTPSSPQLPQIEATLIEEAKKAGVQHIVKQSVLGADIHAHCPFTSIHAYAEEAVKASGIAYTFLRLSSFMQNFVTLHARTISEQGRFYEPLGDARLSHVDTRDIAALAATVLTEEGHEGRAYDITGSESLSNYQLAAMLSTLLDRQVTYISTSDEDLRQILLNSGASNWYADSLVKLYQFYRDGGGALVSTDLEQLIRRQPRTMAAYLQENVEAFRA